MIDKRKARETARLLRHLADTIESRWDHRYVRVQVSVMDIKTPSGESLSTEYPMRITVPASCKFQITPVIWTIGRIEGYREHFMEARHIIKMGRRDDLGGKPYIGGVVFQDKKWAEKYLSCPKAPKGFGVFPVVADWDRDTYNAAAENMPGMAGGVAYLACPDTFDSVKEMNAYAHVVSQGKYMRNLCRDAPLIIPKEWVEDLWWSSITKEPKPPSTMPIKLIASYCQAPLKCTKCGWEDHSVWPAFVKALQCTRCLELVPAPDVTDEILFPEADDFA